MARLGAGQGDQSFPPCGEHGWCLRAGARIAVPVGGCGRELGRCFSCSSQPAGLPRSLKHQGQGGSVQCDPCPLLAPGGGTLSAVLLHFLDVHDTVNFQDRAVGVSSRCFHSGDVCQFVLSWCWQENIPQENNPVAFPLALSIFFAAASLLHVPSFSVYAAPSLDVASFLFAVCPLGCSCWSLFTPTLSLSHPSAVWSLLKPSPGSFQPWLPLLLLLRGFQTPLPC